MKNRNKKLIGIISGAVILLGILFYMIVLGPSQSPKYRDKLVQYNFQGVTYRGYVKEYVPSSYYMIECVEEQSHQQEFNKLEKPKIIHISLSKNKNFKLIFVD